MATLTRSRTRTSCSRADPGHLGDLAEGVPAPFPTHVLRDRDLQQLDELVEDRAGPSGSVTTAVSQPEYVRSPPYSSPKFEESPSYEEQSVHSDVLTTIAHVQQSCLMTLNNVLYDAAPRKMDWQHIVPSRRHSMPSDRAQSSASTVKISSYSSALETLLVNVGSYFPPEEMLELANLDDDAALICELQKWTNRLSSRLDPRDGAFVEGLVSLLAHLDRLSHVDGNLLGRTQNSLERPSLLHNGHSTDVYSQLKRQLSDLQELKLGQDMQLASGSSTPLAAVETALLWMKIEQGLETVLSFCLERTEPAPLSDHLPPEYDMADLDRHHLPEYDAEHVVDDHRYISDKAGASLPSTSQHAVASDKMRLDLDAVTRAIDRLYRAAPQLHNQRVELNRRKLEQMERARQAGPSRERSQLLDEDRSKRKEEELDNIIHLIDKASNRRLTSQSVVLDGDMQSLVGRAQLRNLAKREAFVTKLVEHAGSRRLHDQDAVLNKNKPRNPNALSSLPGSAREEISETLRTSVGNPEEMLTLPEFIKEAPPNRFFTTTSRVIRKQGNVLRKRSMSAPSLFWLIHPSRSMTSSPMLPTIDQSQSASQSPAREVLAVRYVAEHHENLRHVLIFLSIDDATPSVTLEAEVLPSTSDPSIGDCLLLKCGHLTSAPLRLPTRVVSGRHDVLVQRAHCEVKLPTVPSGNTGTTSHNISTPLLDATHLSSIDPTSFICASCSLPLVQAPRKLTYHDLPSQYWSELLDSWMCHPDQRLHNDVARHSKGLWPRLGQALVGGSYILFENSAVVQTNLRVMHPPKADEWRRMQCICGAAVGRWQQNVPTETSSDSDSSPSTIYRFAKYALRPISPNAELYSLPFSAFILEDMTELVHAHATYRFVILDEEEEKPRLLIWLFKPSMQLAYATAAQYALPKTGSIHAAKVLFKLVGPESASVDLPSMLDKYPGFPQAEQLLYPLDICRRLAGLLKASNTAYPVGMRVMTGLLVGWLSRD